MVYCNSKIEIEKFDLFNSGATFFFYRLANYFGRETIPGTFWMQWNSCYCYCDMLVLDQESLKVVDL